MTLPDDVASLAWRYLVLVDGALPGQVEGLYLVGSVALDDYQPGRSDVDFVAVTGQPLDSADLDALDRVHTKLRAEFPKPFFDGIYVTWDALTRDPSAIGCAPHTHEGRFDPARGFEANPSVWLVLDTRGVPLRGPEHPPVWRDGASIRRWNLRNLQSYWRNAVRQRQRRRLLLLASERTMNASVAWCVPGVSRLHYTIVTGDVTSKGGACLYALERFPQRWHPVIREAASFRAGDPITRRGRRARLEDLLGFMEFVIEDAERQAAGFGVD